MYCQKCGTQNPDNNQLCNACGATMTTKTTAANQELLWQYRKRSENPNLDCHQRLRSGSDRQERTQNRTEFGRNPANSQHCPFRESLYYTSTYSRKSLLHKYLRKLCRKIIIFSFITNCYYSTYNGTVVI